MRDEIMLQYQLGQCLPGNLRGAAKHTPAFMRFLDSKAAINEGWRDGETYDLAAIGQLTAKERKLLVAMLADDDMTWREVEALAMVKGRAARGAVARALRHHLSIDTRLAAAEIMHRQNRLKPLDVFLACQIRHLHQPENGLHRALHLAERHPTDVVKQALLWASYNRTDCAPPCAGLLLYLTGCSGSRFDPESWPLLSRLGRINALDDRDVALTALCQITGMTLDYSLAI